MQLITNGLNEKSCGVYVISNKKDSRIYIGSASKFRRRFLDHREMLRKGTHHSKHLQSFVNKYGVDSLEFSLVYECSTRSFAYELEQGLINKLKPKFNMTHKVFKHMEGVKVSDEVRAKIAKTSYTRFKEQNYNFVEDLIRLSQTITHNKELAKQLGTSESKVCEFKSRGGSFMKNLIAEVESKLELQLVKSSIKQTQLSSSSSKFITKYGSIDNYKSELRQILVNISNGVPKSKACINSKISFNSFYSIINGISYKEHSSELLDEFKEFI